MWFLLLFVVGRFYKLSLYGFVVVKTRILVLSYIELFLEDCARWISRIEIGDVSKKQTLVKSELLKE